MPLYEYLCESCGRRYERIERPSELHDGVCPECGGVAHRLLSAPALQFKGSGWYVTDYGRGNGGAAAGSGTAEAAAPAASSADAGSGAASSAETSKPAASDSKVA